MRKERRVCQSKGGGPGRASFGCFNVLEQMRNDTRHFALDQVMRIDRQLVRPDTVITFLHFTIIRDGLYRVRRDTHSGEEVSQLLIPTSHR